MFELTSDDPLHPAYFYSTIITLLALLGVLNITIYFLRLYTVHSRKRAMSSSLDDDKQYDPNFVDRKDSLKWRYLVAYVLTRASIWSKSPYLYTMYNKYHGFSLPEIGVLYVIDA